MLSSGEVIQVHFNFAHFLLLLTLFKYMANQWESTDFENVLVTKETVVEQNGVN